MARYIGWGSSTCKRALVNKKPAGHDSKTSWLSIELGFKSHDFRDDVINHVTNSKTLLIRVSDRLKAHVASAAGPLRCGVAGSRVRAPAAEGAGAVRHPMF